MNEQEAVQQLSRIVNEPCESLEEAVTIVRGVVRYLEETKEFWYERHARTRRMVQKGAYVRQELRRAQGAVQVGVGDEIDVDRRLDAVFSFLDECLLELRFLDSWPARGPFLLPERCPRYCVCCRRQTRYDGFCDECASACAGDGVCL